MTHEYDDIINLPHPTSKVHPRLSMYQRAAQFAPFAALTGHDSAIKETARLTGDKAELSEQEKSILDAKMRILIDNIKEHPYIKVTHFVRDIKKKGGEYKTVDGFIKKWDDLSQTMTLDCGTEIESSSIADIQSNIFPDTI